MSRKLTGVCLRAVEEIKALLVGLASITPNHDRRQALRVLPQSLHRIDHAHLARLKLESAETNNKCNCNCRTSHEIYSNILIITCTRQ